MKMPSEFAAASNEATRLSTTILEQATLRADSASGVDE
jgi:hypothetical protein